MTLPNMTEQLTLSYMGKCVHFTGIQNDRCDAGVRYIDVRDASQPGPYRWPCMTINGRAATTECVNRCFPTREEAHARAVDIETRMGEAARKLAEGKICPHCDRPIEARRVVGRCEYLMPCGHRLGQVGP